MPGARSRDDILDGERFAPAGIERSYSGFEIGTKRSNFFDVRKQPATDLLLIGLRQRRDFLDGFCEYLCHTRHYSTFAFFRIATVFSKPSSQSTLQYAAEIQPDSMSLALQTSSPASIRPCRLLGYQPSAQSCVNV